MASNFPGRLRSPGRHHDVTALPSACPPSSHAGCSSIATRPPERGPVALLGGDADQGRVTTVHLARNRLASPYRYEVDSPDLVRIVHAIEEAGEDLVAIFHSHPMGSPTPSPTDRREARYAAIHLIAGFAAGGPILEAWRLDGLHATRVRLAIDDTVSSVGEAFGPGRT